MNPLAGITGKPLNALITICSTVGFLLFGYDNGVFSGLIVNPWFLETFHYPDSTLLGTISALYNVGGFIGSVVAFFVGHVLGRRRTILVGVFMAGIGTIPFCAATSIATLASGRIVNGIGVGCMTSTVGLWQAETTPSEKRGRYLVAQLLFGASFGLFLAQWINFAFFNNTGRVAFVFPVAFQLVFLLIAGVLVVLLPESPRWLVKYGRTNEALEILTRLVGADQAQRHVTQILDVEGVGRGHSDNQFSALFSNGRFQNFRRVCLACGVMIMHQFGGINSVTHYLPTLLKTFLNTGHRQTLWISGLSSVEAMLCCLVAVITIDSVGRIPFLLYGSIFQSAIFVIIAALLGTSPPDNHTYGFATVVMLFIYFGGNSACWLGPSWAYPAEILPLQIREKGLALGNCCYWLFQFMMVEITPIAIENIYYKFYIVLAILNALNATILWLFYPETKRMSLEELDFYFARKYGNESPHREFG